MTKLSPDEKCQSCGGVLVPPSVATQWQAPEGADYVCLRCGRPYRLAGTPPRLVTLFPK